jgi:hypothetical protein
LRTIPGKRCFCLTNNWRWIAGRFADTIGAGIKPEAGQTYFKLKLTEEGNPIAFKKFLGSPLDGMVRQLQFGYDHHRAIFRLSFDRGMELTLDAIRDTRAEAHRLVREKCFDKFTGKTISLEGCKPLQINYVYSYALIVVPGGYQALEEERESVKSDGYDTVYTTPTSAFGLDVPDRAQTGSMVRSAMYQPKCHYVRISVPSTIVYVSGMSISPELLDRIVDAIYYGGLWEKIRMDRSRADTSKAEFSARDTWPVDLMLSVLRILMGSVGTYELGSISMRVARFSLCMSVIAFLAALIVPVAIVLVRFFCQ